MEYLDFTASEIAELTKEAYLAFVKHQHRRPPLEDDEAEQMWQNLPLVDICRYGRWDFREAVYAVLRRSREMLLERLSVKGLKPTEQAALDCTSRELDELAAAASIAHYVERCANDCAYTDWTPVAQAVLRKRREQLLLRGMLEGATTGTGGGDGDAG